MKYLQFQLQKLNKIIAKVNVFALKSLSPNACYMKSNKSVKPVCHITNKHIQTHTHISIKCHSDRKIFAFQIVKTISFMQRRTTIDRILFINVLLSG